MKFQVGLGLFSTAYTPSILPIYIILLPKTKDKVLLAADNYGDVSMR